MHTQVQTYKLRGDIIAHALGWDMGHARSEACFVGSCETFPSFLGAVRENNTYTSIGVYGEYWNRVVNSRPPTVFNE